MANISDYWAFDYAGPTSNSNVAGSNVAENCAPSGINNAIRALAGMLAQATALQSSAISSSVSTNIAATGTSIYVPITGANAINSFGTVAGQQPSAAVIRLLEFSSSASLSHGTSLILLGQRSRRTQPGDVGGYIHEGSADIWREWLWSPSDGGVSGNSISVSLVNATAINVTSLSASVINVAGVQEFPRITFSAFKAVAQASISGSATVVFGTEEWDVGSYFASNTYTPPAGKYRLTVQLDWSLVAGGGGNTTLRLLKNGATHREVIDVIANSGSFTQICSTLVDANGTDAFAVAALATSTTPGDLVQGANRTFFQGERI